MLISSVTADGIKRAGLVSFPISTNNSADAIAHLLVSTGAQAVVVGPKGNAVTLDERLEEAITLVKKRNGPHFKAIPWPKEDVFINGPSIDTTLPIPPFSPQLPMDILHSSGTTSKYPKPIVQRQTTFRFLHHLFNYGTENVFNCVTFVGHLPPAHAMSSSMCHASYAYGQVIGLMPPVNPPLPFTPDPFISAMVAVDALHPLFAPNMLEACVRAPAVLEKLKHWSLVTFGGGPLPQPTADALRKNGIRPYSLLGSTELTTISRWSSFGKMGTPSELDWDEVELHPGCGIEFRPLDDQPGTYEVVGVAKPPYFQPSVYNDTWRGQPIYATGDRCKLTTPAPDGAPRFKLLGRIDSGLVLSTGEKTNPEPILALIKQNPLVSDAIMFGHAKPHNGVLIEPHAEHAISISDDAQLAGFRNKVWPDVEKANKFAPTHSAM